MMNQPIAPQTARWDPVARHEMAIVRIERAVELALKHSAVRFTEEDLEYVGFLMGLRQPHDTVSTARGGETGSRSSVRKQINPNKRYRLKSGEVVTGAEILSRREQNA